MLLVLPTFCVLIAFTGATEIQSSNMKFPGPTKRQDLDILGAVPESEIPESCRGETFCTIKPASYSEERNNQLLKNHKPKFIPLQVVADEITLDNRQGDVNEKDNCQYTVEVTPLYLVLDSEDKVMKKVIQAPEQNYKQIVRIEKCIKTDGCFAIFPKVNKFTTYCEQKENTWMFLVDDGTSKPKTVKTKIPSCCSCQYKMND